MVYFYISITLTIIAYMYMTGWSEEPAFKLCAPFPSSSIPSTLAVAVWLLSPLFTCLADCNSSNTDLPAIHLSPFQTTIHKNGGLINLFSLSPTPYLSSLPGLMLHSLNATVLFLLPRMPWPLYPTSAYLFIPQDSLFCIRLLCISFPLSHGKKWVWFWCTTDLST